MGFNDIIGQKAAIKILQDELRGGRVNHAYLFLGKEGVGKKTTAFEFAKAINCLEVEADSCGVCLQCRKIKHANHPDVKLIEIEGGNTLKIDQIRQLQKELAYKPYESSRKIYIVDDADEMTTEAANSLLKTLEEPPAYGVLILLAREINKLLPTVISRCQRVNFVDIKEETIYNELVNRGLEGKRAQVIAPLADGSLGRALAYAEDEDFQKKREEILNLAFCLPEIDTVSLFQRVDKMVQFLNEEIDFPFFNLILSWYRDIIIYNQGYKKRIVNRDYIEQIKEHAKIYTMEELLGIVELIRQTRNYLKKHVRKDLSLQVMLFKIRAKRV